MLEELVNELQEDSGRGLSETLLTLSLEQATMQINAAEDSTIPYLCLMLFLLYKGIYLFSEKNGGCVKMRRFSVIEGNLFCLVSPLHKRLNQFPIRDPLPYGFLGTGGKNFFLVFLLESFVVGE